MTHSAFISKERSSSLELKISTTASDFGIMPKTLPLWNQVLLQFRMLEKQKLLKSWIISYSYSENLFHFI